MKVTESDYVHLFHYVTLAMSVKIQLGNSESGGSSGSEGIRGGGGVIKAKTDPTTHFFSPQGLLRG